ncbi:MAG: hypothetical protein CMP23_14835 [Rickettsiales bacterium]|nr:hypothetical protein [Rickettsiales bacterium]
MITLIPILFAVVLSWVSYRALKRKRLIENVPTTDVLGISMGLNEVTGTVECEAPISAHLSKRSCIWYSYTIQEFYRRVSTRTDDEGNEVEEVDEGWETVDSGSAAVPFLLRDDTGAVRVIPEKAEVTGERVHESRAERLPRDLLRRPSGLERRKPPAAAIPFADRRSAVAKYDGGAALFDLVEDDDPIFAEIPYRHRKGGTGYYRLREEIIEPGDELYVLGTGRCRDDIAEPELAWDEVDDTFILSVKGEAEIVKSEHWSAVLGFVGALLAVLGAVWLLAEEGHLPLERQLGLVLGGLGYLACAGLLYGVMLYNGLISVRHRVLRSWSLIDVQLKRRRELIPRLAECAKGYASHEQEVQQAMAEMRALKKRPEASGIPSGGQVRRGVKAEVAQRQAMTKLIALAEGYPDLQASSLFLELQNGLTDTENRIALARRFYNDSVTVYNDRIATLPDLFVARLVRFGKARLYRLESDQERRRPEFQVSA